MCRHSLLNFYYLLFICLELSTKYYVILLNLFPFRVILYHRTRTVWGWTTRRGKQIQCDMPGIRRRYALFIRASMASFWRYPINSQSHISIFYTFTDPIILDAACSLCASRERRWHEERVGRRFPCGSSAGEHLIGCRRTFSFKASDPCGHSHRPPRNSPGTSRSRSISG